ncbi:hypothetical protein SAMN04488057_103355 [Cyclobacterium lianum]|uniref:Uncharacterized protein n=1 Tax=Cyclobacterium lianum TaxID=388280 RepID=A0A1M7LPJ8_9BACT|nr:hypothetical protein SAMN04488057_103355 [Cyclobacterium lianum]
MKFGCSDTVFSSGWGIGYTVESGRINRYFSFYFPYSENPALKGLNNNNRGCSPRRLETDKPTTPEGVEHFL